MTIGVPIVTCLHRVRLIHKVCIRVRRIHKAPIGSRTWAFQRTHPGTPKIQDGGDPPSWILTPKCKKTRFSQKLSIVELWCLLTTCSKLCKLNWAFQRIGSYNRRRLRHAILKIDMTSFFSAEGGLICIKFCRLVQNDMSTAVICGNGNQM